MIEFWRYYFIYVQGTKSIKVTVKFGDKPMTSAFLEFLQAVKAKDNISTALRHLHFRIGERLVQYVHNIACIDYCYMYVISLYELPLSLIHVYCNIYVI